MLALPVKKKYRLNLNSDLPEDITLNILCRLPVKSLIRFSCVSKRWRSIIVSDPQFGKDHLKLASEKGTITRRLFLTEHGLDDEEIPELGVPYQFKSLETSFGDDSLVRNLTIPPEEHGKVLSCNGLVALGSFSKGWSIWNPSTRFHRKIPAPDYSLVKKKRSCPWREDYDFTNVLVGFGYASSIDDYKLIVLVSPIDDESSPWMRAGTSSSNVLNIFIFSMRANSWKLREASRWPARGYSPRCVYGTLSNEAVHWANHHREYNYDIYINLNRPQVEEFDVCAFDLENEELRNVPVPDCFNHDIARHGDRTMQTVDHAGGCLCLWSETYHGEIELWIMRDYGVCNSWMNLFKFRKSTFWDVLGGVPIWEPSLVMESGEIVIELDEKELVRIECCKNKELVCIGRYRLDQEAPGCRLLSGATLYDETLVSL